MKNVLRPTRGLACSKNNDSDHVLFCFCVCSVITRDVHGNGKDQDPMGPMGFPWEWEYDKPWDGNWMEMGLMCVGNRN